MKILLLSYYYPPDRAVGGQRARKVAEALSAAGHDVTVIAAGITAAESQGLVRIKPMPSARELWVWLQSRGQQAKGSEASGVQPAIQVAEDGSRQIARWKRWIFSLIWLPDDRQGYILPAVWRAMREPSGRPDLIYTTAPPFSVHLAGLLFKGLTGTRWVAEFRDPWTSNPWKPGFLRSELSDQIERYLEKLCLSQADVLVPVSDGIADRIRDRVHEATIITIRNGIDRVESTVSSSVLAQPSPFEIMYTGSFYHSRSPFPFLEAVAQLISSTALDDAELLVRFVGTKETYNGVSIVEFICDRGLTEVVRLEKWIERGACLQQMRSADALFLLATDQPDQVPNKLYDYLGTRRPILAITDNDGESARMLRRSGGHIVITENKTPLIKVAIQEILRLPKTAVGDVGLLNQWTSERQMANLLVAVGALELG